MGRHVGVEVSINTSLNVKSPIALSPAQAIQTLVRARGMTGLIMIGEEGDAFLAWHNVDSPPKDAGRYLLQCHEEWKRESLTDVLGR